MIPFIGLKIDSPFCAENNLQRLETLARHSEPKIAALAALIRNIARVLPGKRNRWLKLARRHLLGAEFFEDLLAGYGDFDSPLWRILERYTQA